MLLVDNTYGDPNFVPGTPGNPYPDGYTSEIEAAVRNELDRYNIPWTGDDLNEFTASIVANRDMLDYYRQNSSPSAGLLHDLLIGTAKRPGYAYDKYLASSIDSASADETAAIAQVYGMTRRQYDVFKLQEEQESKFKADHEKTYAAWEKYFGAEPTQQQIMDVEAHGKDLAQWEDYIRAMPSHLQGISIGQYTDLRKSADAISQQQFGYSSNDSQIQELYNRKLMTANEINYYYGQLSAEHGIQAPPIVKNAAWAAANNFTQGIWNQTPSPADVHTMWLAAGSPSELPAQQASDLGHAANPQPGPQPAPEKLPQ